jgi:hypothetical protein
MTFGRRIPRTFDDSTRQWIARHVSSVEQLDLLLLLDEDRSRFWSVGNAASRLRLPRAVVHDAAEVLAARNFLEVRFGEDVLYRLDPGSPDLHSLVECLADAGRRSRSDAVRSLGLRRVSAAAPDPDAGPRIPDDNDDNGGHGPRA